MAGLHVPAVALFAAWFCAWKNVRLSAMLMLVLEGASTAPILLLWTTLAQRGFTVDRLQLDTAALPLSGPWSWHRRRDLQPGLFRTRNRLRRRGARSLATMPRAVVLGLLISGLLFVFVTYVMVQAAHGITPTLERMDAPLNVMASLAPVRLLQIPVSLGAMVSVFALCLSCLNAGGRIISAIGRHGLHVATAGAHAAADHRRRTGLFGQAVAASAARSGDPLRLAGCAGDPCGRQRLPGADGDDALLADSVRGLSCHWQRLDHRRATTPVPEALEIKEDLDLAHARFEVA